jgi:hypothetical protein
MGHSPSLTEQRAAQLDSFLNASTTMASAMPLHSLQAANSEWFT